MQKHDGICWHYCNAVPSQPCHPEWWAWQAVQKTAKQREWAMHEDVKVRRLELRLAIICSCIIASFALFL